MKPRTVVILAVATLILAVAAVVVDTRGRAVSSAGGGELLFPGLAAKINDAAKITVATADHKFTVARQDGNWVVVDKHGYPAKFDTVRSTLVGLAELRTVEAKTAEPSLYPRLEVENVTEKGAKSALATVEDAQGATLASLILGKSRYGRGGADNTAMLYVRKPEVAQSWLAQGTLERNDDANMWLQRDIVNIARGRVRQVTVTPTGAPPFAIKKDKPGGGDFGLEAVPPEDKVKSSYEVNAIAGALAALMLDDVLPVKDLKPDAKLVRTLEYKTFDGLVLDLVLYEQDGKTWAKVQATFDSAGVAAAPAAPAESASGETSAAKGSEDEPKPKSADEVKKEVEEITARTKDWAYGLGAGDLATIEKKLADLIEPKEKPKS